MMGVVRLGMPDLQWQATTLADGKRADLGKRPYLLPHALRNNQKNHTRSICIPPISAIAMEQLHSASPWTRLDNFSYDDPCNISLEILRGTMCPTFATEK